MLLAKISHFSRSRKRFYDQVFELLDGSSGGVVVDSFQLHNTVKHCGLSSRRSRVQIPAGALHNRSIISIDTRIISKYPPSSTYSIISRADFSVIISNMSSNGWAEAVVCRSELSIRVSISIHVQTLSKSFSRSVLMKLGVHDSISTIRPLTRTVNGITNFCCYGLSSVSFYKISTTWLNTRLGAIPINFSFRSNSINIGNGVK